MSTPAEQFPVSVAGRVADQLRDLIRDGAYAPGARLVERAIARELGTSHIPVREALARLAEEGLVVRLPRRGARVAELSSRSLEEISSVRVVLEQFVCERVLERWTPSAEAELMRLARRMASAAERGSTKAVGELDVRFHETLWQLADHELLLEVAAGPARAHRALPARGQHRARAGRAAPARARACRARRAAGVGRSGCRGRGDAPPYRGGRRARRPGGGDRPLTLVVITDSDLPSDGVEEALLGAAGIDVRRAACRTSAEVAAAGSEADALIVQWAPVDEAALAQMPRLRFISRLGIGYDMIDVDAAAARGVAVANTPDYCVEEVVAHAIALVLACTRGIVAADRHVRGGGWAVTELAPPVRRPSRLTLGVLGLGRIGSLVVQQARTLGFQVLAHDPAHPGRSVALDDVVAAADVLTLHLPLTPETHHLIDAAALARLRPGAILVNTSRGSLVDEAALVDALSSGRLAGAALDVYEREPLPADSPLRDLPGVILSPHAAWYSPEALTDLPRLATQQVIEFLAGAAVPNVVNAAAAAAHGPPEAGATAPAPPSSGGHDG